MKIQAKDVVVPVDVPGSARQTYVDNYLRITRESGRLMLFAGDQKIEHLNDDFYGKGAHPDDADPEHLFRIASRGKIGVFAAQLGLIARYAMDYPRIPYLVKLNSKSDLVKTKQKEPVSVLLTDVSQVVEVRKETGLGILGVGYTIYLGSEFEHVMLREAAQTICQAHRHGLLAILWIYPRGAAVPEERDPHLIAGATGLGACLGCDFVKVNYPKQPGKSSGEIFREAIKAAGRTKVVCAGGASEGVEEFLQTLHDQIFVSGAAGNATGRNIHQKSLDEAVRMCNAVYAITVEDKSVAEALKIYNG
jgi:fructose-bisphosphate aldolase / 6-deoxy-5-ketofructose 1-phosphate synthase